MDLVVQEVMDAHSNDMRIQTKAIEMLCAYSDAAPDETIPPLRALGAAHLVMKCICNAHFNDDLLAKCWALFKKLKGSDNVLGPLLQLLSSSQDNSSEFSNACAMVASLGDQDEDGPASIGQSGGLTVILAGLQTHCSDAMVIML